MTTHQEAADYAAAGFAIHFGRQPSLTERQALCGVGRLETRYGDGWKRDGVGSNNIGAIQASRPPCNPATSFQYTDTHPLPDGTSTTYAICFKKYSAPADGWADLVRVMYGTSAKPKAALAAATRGDLYGVSAAMRAAGYYEGWGKTQAERIANHHKALYAAVQAAATALKEPMPGGKPTPTQNVKTALQSVLPTGLPKTIRRGSVGKSVADWQRSIGVVADSIFGPVTEEATRSWQTAHGLVGDGVVGRLTWSKLEEETN